MLPKNSIAFRLKRRGIESSELILLVELLLNVPEVPCRIVPEALRAVLRAYRTARCLRTRILGLRR